MSDYKVGDVVVFELSCISDQGLLARIGQLGLVVDNRTLSTPDVDWICGVYVNGHSSIGVEADMIRKATEEETRQFWENQDHTFNLNRSVADALLLNTERLIEEIDKQHQRIASLERLLRA